ncbi:MAG: sporulation transcription factor Spo0A [Bacilli bacterium]|nr:sporulation transcription factor Spo0A [Bacilli bacterium]
MKIKVFVVDDNEGLVGLIKEYFSSSDNIEVVKCASNGEEAINILKEGKIDFDLMLLDLIMPIKDGISVLSYMKENKINKKVIVMTSYNEEETIRDVSEYGVRYYCLKPFDLEDLKNKIIQTITFKKNNDKIIELESREIQIQVTKLLHALGIPSHIKGYQFIRSAILMVYDNPGLIGGITKELYPDLSVKFNTSVQRVERAIRHAIEVSWLRGDIDLMDEIFGHSVDIDKAKPTNSEFIVTIADKLRLDMINVN